MRHDEFQKMCKVLRALGLGLNENPECLAVVKIEQFIKNISEFENNCKEIVKFYNNNPLESEEVVMNKDGNVFLVRSWQIGADGDGNMSWTGAKVTDNRGYEVVLKFDEIMPYSRSSKLLFGKE
jgi:hypothetical protein